MQIILSSVVSRTAYEVLVLVLARLFIWKKYVSSVNNKARSSLSWLSLQAARGEGHLRFSPPCDVEVTTNCRLHLRSGQYYCGHSLRTIGASARMQLQLDLAVRMISIFPYMTIYVPSKIRYFGGAKQEIQPQSLAMAITGNPQQLFLSQVAPSPTKRKDRAYPVPAKS